jgi:iron complex outermembrane receptor protein
MLRKTILFVLSILSWNIYAQENDSVKIYSLTPISVTAKKVALTQTSLSTEKNNLDNLLNTSGFCVIRKGTFFAQDIYGDGLKRNDIEVTIDDERYQCACPNRMDAPMSRVNPLELSEIEMDKNSAALQSGLGGKINFVRKEPSEAVSIRTSLSAFAGHADSYDGALSVDGYKQRVSLRYSTGMPYEDADSKTFEDLYGYKDNYRYKLGEFNISGEQNDFGYGAGFMYTENVSMPYLQMDERLNRIYSGRVSYKENKLYFNYTSHLMNNGLRNSAMNMETDAKNYTVGLTGEHYDVYYRKWTADNIIATPMMTINNNLIPEVSQIYASASYNWNLSVLQLNAKAGFAYNKAGEDNLALYRQIDPEADDNAFFPLLGLSVGVREPLIKNLDVIVLAEGSTDAPSVESQFIAVKRPMGNPTWLGSTNLDVPVKAGLRTQFIYNPAFLELYLTHVWNYVEPNKIVKEGANYQSFENIDAYLLGVNFEINYSVLSFSAGYTYAKNSTTNNPLSEIAPLTLKTVITTPAMYGFEIFARHTYNDAQTRVDPLLGETATPQWNRIDIGASYKYKHLIFSFEADNISNELYYQHLSYLRNPFASGAKVLESGSMFRFNVMFNNIF